VKHIHRICGVAAAVIVLLAFAACQGATGNTPKSQKRLTGEEYEIVIANSISDGTVSVIPNTKIAYEDDTVILTPQPADGYRLRAVSVKRQDTNEMVPLTSKGDVRLFVMPASDVAVTISFSRIPNPDRPEPPPSRPGLIFSSGFLFNTAVLTEKDCWVPWYCDDITGKNGGQVIRAGPEYGEQGGGFSIAVSEESAINLNGTMNALSFWAQSPDDIVIQYVTVGASAIGQGDDYAVAYTGEDNKGISIGDEWTRVIVPIPNRVSVFIDGVFDLWIPGTEEGKVLYIDEIELINASLLIDGVELRKPGEISPSEQIPVSKFMRGMKVVYSVDQTPVSLFNENVQFEKYYHVQYQATGAAQVVDGMVVTQSAGGEYTLNVTLESTQSQVTGTVSNKRFLSIEDCMQTGRIWEWVVNPGGYYTESWYSAFVEDADGTYLTIMNRSASGNGGWEWSSKTRRDLRSAPFDLTQYNEITFRVRALSPGLLYHFRFIYEVEGKSPLTGQVDVEDGWRLDGGGPAEYAKYSTRALPVSNLWQDITIPLWNGDFGLGSDGGGARMGKSDVPSITGWEIGTEEDPVVNFLYIGPFKVR